MDTEAKNNDGENKNRLPDNGINAASGNCENESNEDFCSKETPAGTDPDRYKYIESDVSEAKDDLHEDDYDKKPKNHTTPEERMINPDRGE
ncbi:hypothetical protein KJK34_04955 [Flavobacterium sp. D11R37]|uniref:hypothetical protein n=1 Tax=Flavobacterium coralii TaxID=2838017 RepID=UPI001CA6E73C|nr:hypothetical protein [Flavobacterium coralii]MBY8962097.1 hypothetical protein [Flavobacterium coralii]